MVNKSMAGECSPDKTIEAGHQALRLLKVENSIARGLFQFTHLVGCRTKREGLYILIVLEGDGGSHCRHALDLGCITGYESSQTSLL